MKNNFQMKATMKILMTVKLKIKMKAIWIKMKIFCKNGMTKNNNNKCHYDFWEKHFLKSDKTSKIIYSILFLQFLLNFLEFVFILFSYISYNTFSIIHFLIIMADLKNFIPHFKRAFLVNTLMFIYFLSPSFLAFATISTVILSFIWANCWETLGCTSQPNSNNYLNEIYKKLLAIDLIESKQTYIQN